jgi:hypothetical protein
LPDTADTPTERKLAVCKTTADNRQPEQLCRSPPKRQQGLYEHDYDYDYEHEHEHEHD